MSIWAKQKLGEVVDFIDGDRGTNYPSQGEFFPSGYCLFLSTRNVPNSRFSFEENLFISEEKDAELHKGKLQRGDYVLTTRGTVGNFAYYDRSVPYPNVRINSGMVILRKKSEELNEKFFRYYLSSDSFSGQVKARVSGSAQPQLPIKDMISMEIILPDLITQTCIASILASYDDLIENNERRIKTLEEMARRLYTEWFVKFKFPGHEKVKMVDSGTEFGMIPEGWRSGSMADVFDNLRISTQAGKHLMGRMYVPIEYLPRKSLVLQNFADWKEAQSSLVLFEKGDILFGAMRPYFHKVSIAPFAGVTRTTCFVLRPKEKYFKSFGALTAFSDRVVAFASGNTRGATIPYVVWDGALSNCPVVIPPSDLLNRFENIVETTLGQLAFLSLQNNRLVRMRGLLIPQLVTGKRQVR